MYNIYNCTCTHHIAHCALACFEFLLCARREWVKSSVMTPPTPLPLSSHPLPPPPPIDQNSACRAGCGAPSLNTKPYSTRILYARTVQGCHPPPPPVGLTD
jgi:hypothetical protein